MSYVKLPCKIFIIKYIFLYQKHHFLSPFVTAVTLRFFLPTKPFCICDKKKTFCSLALGLSILFQACFVYVCLLCMLRNSSIPGNDKRFGLVAALVVSVNIAISYCSLILLITIFIISQVGQYQPEPSEIVAQHNFINNHGNMSHSNNSFNIFLQGNFGEITHTSADVVRHSRRSCLEYMTELPVQKIPFLFPLQRRDLLPTSHICIYLVYLHRIMYTTFPLPSSLTTSPTLKQFKVTEYRFADFFFVKMESRQQQQRGVIEKVWKFVLSLVYFMVQIEAHTISRN